MKNTVFLIVVLFVCGMKTYGINLQPAPTDFPLDKLGNGEIHFVNQKQSYWPAGQKLYFEHDFGNYTYVACKLSDTETVKFDRKLDTTIRISFNTPKFVYRFNGDANEPFLELRNAKVISGIEDTEDLLIECHFLNRKQDPNYATRSYYKVFNTSQLVCLGDLLIPLPPGKINQPIPCKSLYSW